MKRSHRLMRAWTAGAILVLALLVGCAPALPDAAALATTSPAETISSVYMPISQPAQGELHSVADVVAKVKPSVVAISTETTSRDLFNRSWTQEGAGSGWIIREDGWIVTNTHVVEDAERVMVTLDDGRSFEAETVYTDSWTDIAVVRIAADGLPVAEVGDSSSLRVGDAVVAIGNSLGMGIGATSGIASAVGVSLASSSGQTLLELVQTDAAINPGNSGGPLVNAAGKVIGINSIKIAQVGVEGMGYAISINEAVPVILDLIEQGTVMRAWLGVSVYGVNQLVASQYSLSVESGVLIAEVVPGSPAVAAGLEVGDVIVVFGARDIRTTNDFTRAIHGLKVGDDVEIVFWRGTERLSTIATLTDRPAD